MTIRIIVVPLRKRLLTAKSNVASPCVAAASVRRFARIRFAGPGHALIMDHFSARQGVEDDHMNIICMGGRTVGPEVAWDLVETFLAAEFSSAERHLRRLGKVATLERNRVGP